jgi:hypothetical protein
VCAGLDESIHGASRLKALGDRFLCKSCPKGTLIMMDFYSLARLVTFAAACSETNEPIDRTLQKARRYGD